MDIKKTLENVLKRRKKGRDKIDGMQLSLNQISEHCTELKDICSNDILIEISKEQNRAEELDSVKSEASKLYVAIEKFKASKHLEIAKYRTGRPYINIGIIAPFRNGKSTLLQSLFGWDDQELKYIIPTDESRSEPCTATSVSYVNEELVLNGERYDNYAHIEYYSEEEMISLIKGECDAMHIKYEKNTLKELVEEISSKLDLKNKTYSVSERALIGYIEGYEQFEQIFGEGKKEDFCNLSQPEGLKSFYKNICYWERPKEKQEDPDRKRSEFARITKKATVYKKLIINGKDPGPIRFMDTPGLGEYRRNVGENLSNVLRRDIDIAIALCKTSDFQIVHLESFNQYVKKDFCISCVVNGQEYNTKDCIYYIVNFDTTSKKQHVDEVFSQIDNTLTTTSLIDNKQYSGLDIKNKHLLMIDCKNNKSYDYEKYKENGDVGKSFIEDCAIENMLQSLLEELSKTIDIIDEQFIAKTLSEVQIIEDNFKNLSKTVHKIGFLKIDNVGEKNRKIACIQEGIRNIYPKYEAEVSYNLFEENIINKGDKQIVDDFLNGKQLTKDNIVMQHDYDALRELYAYERLKEKFRDFFIEKLKECFNTKSMEQAALDTRVKIGELMVNQGLGQGVVCSSPNKWVEVFCEKFKDKYKYLANILQKLMCVNKVDEAITEYVRISLKECFHAEKEHEKGFLFKDPGSTNQTFYSWLQDIAASLISHAEHGMDGTQSFIKLIDKAKNTYNESCSDLYRSLLFGGTAHDDLERIIIDFEDVVFIDLKEKEEVINKWNILHDFDYKV